MKDLPNNPFGNLHHGPKKGKKLCGSMKEKRRWVKQVGGGSHKKWFKTIKAQEAKRKEAGSNKGD